MAKNENGNGKKLFTIQEVVKKAGWTFNDDENVICHCGEPITGSTLPIIEKQFAYCEKCQDVGFIRSLSNDLWAEQRNIKSIISDIL